MFRKVLVSFGFAEAILVVMFTVSMSAQHVCTLNYEVVGFPNVIQFTLDCPDGDETYVQFDFGDGSGFDLLIDSNGDSDAFTHAYAYEIGELNVFTATVNSVGNYSDSFEVVVDARPIFEVGELHHSPGDEMDLWNWSSELRGIGQFTLGLNTSCNGLAGNHSGVFLWELDGPVGGVQFGNWVQSEFIESPLVTATLLLTDDVGSLVWSGEVLGPDCEVPKPEILVEDKPIVGGELVSVTVRSFGKGSLQISTDQLIPEFPEECQPLGGNVPVHSVSCEPGVRTVGVRVGQNASSVHLFARRWFEPIPVESSSEITLTVTPSYECDLGYERGDEYNHAVFQIACEPNPMGWMTLDFGNEVQSDLVVSGTVQVETWYTQVEVPTSYTVTLSLEETIVATRTITITPGDISTGPVIPPIPEFKEVYLPIASHTVFVPKSGDTPYCHEYIANVASKGTICYIGPHTPEGLETSSDVYVTTGDRFRDQDFRQGGGVFPVGVYVYGPFGMSFSEPNPRQ